MKRKLSSQRIPPTEWKYTAYWKTHQNLLRTHQYLPSGTKQSSHSWRPNGIFIHLTTMRKVKRELQVFPTSNLNGGCCCTPGPETALTLKTGAQQGAEYPGWVVRHGTEEIVTGTDIKKGILLSDLEGSVKPNPVFRVGKSGQKDGKPCQAQPTAQKTRYSKGRPPGTPSNANDTG